MMIIRTEVNLKFFILCLLTCTDFMFKGYFISRMMEIVRLLPIRLVNLQGSVFALTSQNYNLFKKTCFFYSQAN